MSMWMRQAARTVRFGSQPSSVQAKRYGCSTTASVRRWPSRTMSTPISTKKVRNSFFWMGTQRDFATQRTGISLSTEEGSIIRRSCGHHDLEGEKHGNHESFFVEQKS